MTISNKADANVEIEELTAKMRARLLPKGQFASDGFRILHDIDNEWGGVGDIPEAVQNLADYKGYTIDQTRLYIQQRRVELHSLFTASDKLKYDAYTDVAALPDDSTAEEIVIVVEKHRKIFETAMGF